MALEPSGLLDGETPELKEDDFSWLELSEEGDLHVITGELDTAQAGELMKKLFGSGWMSSPDSLDQTEEGPGMAFQAKALNITVKVGLDNLIREMTASLSMAYATELPAGSNVESITQTEVTFDISVTMQVQNPGAPVTVTPPRTWTHMRTRRRQPAMPPNRPAGNKALNQKRRKKRTQPAAPHAAI